MTTLSSARLIFGSFTRHFRYHFCTYLGAVSKKFSWEWVLLECGNCSPLQNRALRVWYSSMRSIQWVVIGLRLHTTRMRIKLSTSCSPRWMVSPPPRASLCWERLIRRKIWTRPFFDPVASMFKSTCLFQPMRFVEPLFKKGDTCLELRESSIVHSHWPHTPLILDAIIDSGWCRWLNRCPCDNLSALRGFVSLQWERAKY